MLIKISEIIFDKYVNTIIKNGYVLKVQNADTLMQICQKLVILNGPARRCFITVMCVLEVLFG